MTFNEIIISIEEKINDPVLKKEFKRAYKISPLDDEISHNLGLYFSKLKENHFDIYIKLKDELERLRDFYANKKLLTLFLLKETKNISIKPDFTIYALLFVGAIIFFSGAYQQYRETYSIHINLKTQSPVYQTGLYTMMIGATIITIGVFKMRKGYLYKNFYKDYKKLH